jgi:hypothetical protein
LGQAGYPEYYEDAERTLRNHLLASQLLDVSWIRDGQGVPDDQERTFTNVARRAKGDFGFTTPNDWGTESQPGKAFDFLAALC